MSNHTDPYHNKNLDKDTYHGIEKQFALMFSSAMADFVAEDKNWFKVRLNNPIRIPEKAVTCSVALNSADIWNSSPNIIKGVNDQFVFWYGDDIGAPGLKVFNRFSITLTEGLYSLDQLQDSINDHIHATYPDILHTDPIPTYIQLIENVFSETITIRVDTLHVSYISAIDFSDKNSLSGLLGYDKLRYEMPGDADTSLNFITGPFVAKLNQINAYIITGDLVNDGIPINSRSANIIARVPLLVEANRLITYEPVNPIYIQSDHLIGKAIYDLRFDITNESLAQIKCKEDWYFTLIVKYSM